MLRGIQLSLMIGEIVAAPAPSEVLDALTSAQVTVTSGQRSGFQLTFTVGKRSKILTTLLPWGYFDPPRRVILTATINGIANVLMDGVVTRHELNASNEPGQSTLTVTGEDLSAMMDLVDLTGLIRYPAMPYELRVLIAVGKYAFFGIIPEVIPSLLLTVDNPLTRMPGHQGTDYAYVRYMAEQVGYVFYMEPGPVPGVSKAYWGPEIKVGLPQPALTVNSDAHTNVESLNFSFDGMSKKLFLFYIQNEQTNASFPIPLPDITPLNPPLGLKVPLPLKVEFLNSRPPRLTAAQRVARERREAELRAEAAARGEETDPAGSASMPVPLAALLAMSKASRSADVVSASGTLNVLRYGRVLQPRQLVGVRGAGRTHDGLYYVKSVTHNLKKGEYKQSFSLSRNALYSYTETLPV